MSAPGIEKTPELFDVVNERDEVIGQASRNEVHARDLLHRAVHVMVHDAAGRLFLQRRSPSKDRFPDCWDSSCTGHVDAGEDYQTAAWRELGEELGWFDQELPLRPVLKLSASPETGYEFIEIFVLGPIGGPFTLHPDEITEGRWVTPDELDGLLREAPTQFAGACRLVWEKHRNAVLRVMKGASF